MPVTASGTGRKYGSRDARDARDAREERGTAIAVGILYIIATVMGLASVAVAAPTDAASMPAAFAVAMLHRGDTTEWPRRATSVRNRPAGAHAA